MRTGIWYPLVISWRSIFLLVEFGHLPGAHAPSLKKSAPSAHRSRGSLPPCPCLTTSASVSCPSLPASSHAFLLPSSSLSMPLLPPHALISPSTPAFLSLPHLTSCPPSFVIRRLTNPGSVVPSSIRFVPASSILLPLLPPYRRLSTGFTYLPLLKSAQTTACATQQSQRS